METPLQASGNEAVSWAGSAVAPYTNEIAYLGKSLKLAKGVFDCSCFKVPGVKDFPRVYPDL